MKASVSNRPADTLHRRGRLELRQANGTWSESTVYAFPQGTSAPFPNSNLIWNTSRTDLMGTTGPYSDPAGAVVEVTP